MRTKNIPLYNVASIADSMLFSMITTPSALFIEAIYNAEYMAKSICSSQDNRKKCYILIRVTF